MKFGKEFSTHLEETLPEWRDKYLCYKPLKKLLKHIPSSAADNPPPPPPPAPAAATELQEWFIRILNEELDKFNDFYVDKEEDFIIRFQVLLSIFVSESLIVCKFCLNIPIEEFNFFVVKRLCDFYA